MAQLIAAGNHAFDLAPGVVHLGEDPKAEIPILPGLGLASRHFVLYPHETVHLLKSLAEPPLMTFINGHPINGQTVLKDGDTIRAGQLELRYSSPAPEPVPDPIIIPKLPEIEPHRNGNSLYLGARPVALWKEAAQVLGLIALIGFKAIPAIAGAGAARQESESKRLQQLMASANAASSQKTSDGSVREYAPIPLD